MNRRYEILASVNKSDPDYIERKKGVCLLTPLEALQAMDIYAKEKAIEFVKWCAANLEDLYIIDGDMKGGYENELLSGDQIYNLFIKSNNNGE